MVRLLRSISYCATSRLFILFFFFNLNTFLCSFLGLEKYRLSFENFVNKVLLADLGLTTGVTH